MKSEANPAPNFFIPGQIVSSAFKNWSFLPKRCDSYVPYKGIVLETDSDHHMVKVFWFHNQKASWVFSELLMLINKGDQYEDQQKS